MKDCLTGVLGSKGRENREALAFVARRNGHRPRRRAGGRRSSLGGRAPPRQAGHRSLHPAARQLRRTALTTNSTDQLPLYSGLTPLRDNVTRDDINRLFLPENFQPIGPTHEEQTGRPGLRLIYDSYGIPHVYGQTRADVAFGAGWATARDRGLLLQLGRGPARAAVADVPNINAFSLVTSGQSFVPSAETEALVTQQQKLLVDTYGDKGRQILADAQAYADGINAYSKPTTSTSRRRPSTT